MSTSRAMRSAAPPIDIPTMAPVDRTGEEAVATAVGESVIMEEAEEEELVDEDEEAVVVDVGEVEVADVEAEDVFEDEVKDGGVVIVAATYVASGCLVSMQENQRRVGEFVATQVCQKQKG